MSQRGTKFEVHVNEKLVASATVSVADQIEINLVSLCGQDDAVLAVTAFLPDAPKRDNYVHTRRVVIAPGDKVTIALDAASGVASTTVTASDDPRADAMEYDGNGSGDVSGSAPLKCGFCGKSQHEVRKVVAGQNVVICDACVALCQEIIDDEN